MEIEHYPGMTEKAIGAIRDEARGAVAADRGAGDPSATGCWGRARSIMMVATAAPHRGDAFAAAEFLMDYLKVAGAVLEEGGRRRRRRLGRRRGGRRGRSGALEGVSRAGGSGLSAEAGSVALGEFRRPDGVLIAGMGLAIIGAALAGAGAALVLGRTLDLGTLALIGLGVAGAGALGAGFINAWRTPMLTIRPDTLTVPTVFGAREIPIAAGHPVGELVASAVQGSTRGGTIEANKFVHFYTLDAGGALTELVALHRAAPMIEEIRRGFREIAGLKVEALRLESEVEEIAAGCGALAKVPSVPA